MLGKADKSLAWSAPSAIGLAGVGVGGQAGAEMTDFLVVLNSQSVSDSERDVEPIHYDPSVLGNCEWIALLPQ